MSCYIVCHQKINNPRMDVRICEKKCSLKESCKDYISYCKVASQNNNANLSSDSQSVSLRAA